jgi:ribosomal protein L32
MKKAYPCPKCGEVTLANKCPKCGHEFMPETPKPKMVVEEGEDIIPPKKKGKRLPSDKYLK